MRSSGTTRIDGHGSDSKTRSKVGDKLGSGKGRAAGTAAPGRSATRGRTALVRPMPTAEELAARVGWREAIDATVAGLGYELVDVEREQRGLLRVTIDRVPGRTYPVAADSEFVTVEDCEQVTRQLQYVLQVEGLDYARLEVSSPGLDRLLRSDADLVRFQGHAVSISLKLPFEGRKSWQGVLGRDGLSDATGLPAGDDQQDSAWQLIFEDRGTARALGFRMQEVREARLVPVVDFKGRKSALRESGSGLANESAGELAVDDEEAAGAPGLDGG